MEVSPEIAALFEAQRIELANDVPDPRGECPFAIYAREQAILQDVGGPAGLAQLVVEVDRLHLTQPARTAAEMSEYMREFCRE